MAAFRKLMAAERIWRRVRSDETLDDLSQKILPAPEEVPTSLSPDLVGDCLALVEFQKVFGSEKSFGTFRYSSLNNLTLSNIADLLQEQTTSGLFCDILFFYIQVRTVRFLFLSITICISIRPSDSAFRTK